MIKATLIDYMGSDLSVVNAARVSFGNKHEVFKDKKDTKLINFLARNNHVSPFGHAFASFHVSAPIFIARQLVKHKFLRWNEISRRYVSNEPKLYEPTTWRGKSHDKKQGSSDIVVIEGVEIRATQAYDISLYKHLLDMGICEEQARIVLPANLMTEWYWSGSLDAFADMCKLRCTSDTHNETKIIADEINDIMKRLYPVSWDALLDSQ